MAAPTPQAGMERLMAMIQPWHQALQNPAAAQEKVLQGLLAIYAQTGYGQQHNAGKVGSTADYRGAFPVATYEDYQPLLQRVMGGEVEVFLNETPVGWAITRGTTKGSTKFIPMTPTDLKMRVSAGRAVLNYAAAARKLEIFAGVNLNLNFPSRVGSVKVGDREVEYGYSSGIYTRHVSTLTPVRSVPAQEAIDALGGGRTVRDWEARYELAYAQCKEQNVTLVGGVAPTALDFGRYLRKTHHAYPKDLWKVLVMTLGSVPGINTRLEPALHAMYGDGAAIREIYGATEGMFGQQMDEKRAWTPNYDLFFFEVSTRGGIKLLHEMRPGELGSLVVSTPVLARYEIGDLILALNPPYFRCIGRQKWHTPLVYAWDEFRSFNFGRL
jgi:hypothetical protein